MIKEHNGRFFNEADAIGTAVLQATLAKAGFNPFEPRDHRGWWTQGANSLQPEQVKHRGHFHNFMVDHVIENLTSRGVKAIKTWIYSVSTAS